MATFQWASVRQSNTQTSVNVIGFGGAFIQGSVQLASNTAIVTQID
jgi:hypothetical protein